MLSRAHTNRLAVGFHDVLHDGQPQAGASTVARAAFIHAVEAIEEVGQVLFGDADAIVGYFYEDVFVHIVETYFGVAAGIAVVDGIVEQIGEYLPDAFSVSSDFKALAGTFFVEQFDLAFAALHFGIFEDFLHQIADIENGGLQDQIARFQATDGAQVIYNHL